jgi:hypothetical protein
MKQREGLIATTTAAATDVLLMILLHVPSREHRSNSASIVVCVSVAGETYLPSRCLETALHPVVTSRLNTCSFYGIRNL